MGSEFNKYEDVRGDQECVRSSMTPSKIEAYGGNNCKDEENDAEDTVNKDTSLSCKDHQPVSS